MSDNASPKPPLVLLTRPRGASDRFAADMREALGPLEVVIVPLTDIAPVVQALDLEGVAALVFTSAAGVEVFAGLTEVRDLPAWCVGDRTASAARAIGLRATSAGGDADALVALMADTMPEGRLLHLHGRHTRGDVVERLVAAGMRAEGLAIYDQAKLTPGNALAGALAHPGGVIAPLFSPRSARLFAEVVDVEGVRVRPVALSHAVRDALPEGLAGHTVCADSPDAAAMIRAIGALISP